MCRCEGREHRTSWCSKCQPAAGHLEKMVDPYRTPTRDLAKPFTDAEWAEEARLYADETHLWAKRCEGLLGDMPQLWEGDYA